MQHRPQSEKTGQYDDQRHQKTGVYALLGALVLVVAGSMAGESLGINGKWVVGMR